MKDRYKEKNCKFCEKPHKKRGLYCCQSCANRDRPEYSPKVAEAMRKVAIDYNRTPEAIAAQKLFGSGIASEDFAVNIPDVTDLSDYSEFLDGYDRGEKW